MGCLVTDLDVQLSRLVASHVVAHANRRLAVTSAVTSLTAGLVLAVAVVALLLR